MRAFLCGLVIVIASACASPTLANPGGNQTAGCTPTVTGQPTVVVTGVARQADSALVLPAGVVGPTNPNGASEIGDSLFFQRRVGRRHIEFHGRPSLRLIRNLHFDPHSMWTERKNSRPARERAATIWRPQRLVEYDDELVAATGSNSVFRNVVAMFLTWRVAFCGATVARRVRQNATRVAARLINLRTNNELATKARGHHMCL
jgi:hypothetical protein